VPVSLFAGTPQLPTVISRDFFEEFDGRDWEAESVDGTVRLAVVGLGQFAQTQALPGIADTDYCEVPALVTGSPEKGENAASEHGVDRVLSYEKFEDGSASDVYDAVYVATPTGRHLESVEAAAEQGKHVITEKPMEKSLDRAERLRDACDVAEVTLMVAYRPRTEPAFLRAREAVRAGVIGEPTHFDGSFSFRVLELGGPDQWRIDPGLAGGGALMDAGVYLANLSQFFLDAEPASVRGTTVSEGDAFEGVDERATFDVQFEDGATASCVTSFSDYYDDRIRVRGTDGKLSIRPAFWFNERREITLSRDDGDITVTVGDIDEVSEEFAHFGYSVLTGTEPMPSGDVGVRDLELLEAVYESAETGERVTV
jgi:xylose dehydrogenase (NAD/NADP)